MDNTKLKEKTEIVGVLSNIEKIDGISKLTFTIHHTVEVPSSELEYENLYDLKGKHIGMVRIDSKYKIRKIQDKS